MFLSIKKTFLCFYVTAHCHKKVSLERIFKPQLPLVRDDLTRLQTTPVNVTHPSAALTARISLGEQTPRPGGAPEPTMVDAAAALLQQTP